MSCARLTGGKLILQTIISRPADIDNQPPFGGLKLSDTFFVDRFLTAFFIEKSLDGDSSNKWLYNFDCNVAMLGSVRFEIEQVVELT